MRRATALLRDAASGIEGLSRDDAAALATLFAEAGRVAQSATIRLARAIGDEGARRGSGYRDAATFLSTVSGSSVTRAKDSLEAAERMDEHPVLSRAFSSGDLSLDQALVIAPVAAVAPREAEALLDAAKALSLRELKTEADRVRRRARREVGQVELERRVHQRRYCRVTTLPEGGVRLEALLSSVDGASVKGALEKEADRVFGELWAAGVRDETADHIRADALVRLLSDAAGSAGADPSGAGRGPEVLVRVDAAALVRGEVGDGEVCEIDGIGPVSVEAARQLLGEGFFTLLVQTGRDIRCVTSTTRDIPTRVEKALRLRDQTCVVPGCSTSLGLQTDHWRRDFGHKGPTELDNLCRLCAVHHRLKTRTGWRLVGGPGRWRWLPPRAGPGPVRRT